VTIFATSMGRRDMTSDLNCTYIISKKYPIMVFYFVFKGYLFRKCDIPIAILTAK